jgi:hypothetical protein
MNRAEIPIARPCTADWTRMTLADRGRFCGACRKVVRELAQMNEHEARALLASPPTEGLCVRYVHDATGEILFRRDDVVPAGRLLRRAAMLALGAALPLASVACMGAAPAAMGAPPVVTPQPSATVTEPPPQVMMGAPPVPSATTPAAESSPK